jgi:hypothetical protein
MKPTLAVLLLLTASPALAQQVQVSKRATFAGKNELGAQLGFQGSMGATTPAGVKLFIDYARQLGDYVWLNFQVNPIFAVGSTRAVCYDRFGNPFDCNSGSGLEGDGHAIDLLAGIKLKFPIQRVALVPYANIQAGVVPIFDRPRNDNGAAVVLHTGGGLRYFVTPHVGLGGEFNFTLGPGFYSETCNNCQNSHTEFYRAIDFGIGAEFIL